MDHLTRRKSGSLIKLPLYHLPHESVVYIKDRNGGKDSPLRRTLNGVKDNQIKIISQLRIYDQLKVALKSINILWAVFIKKTEIKTCLLRMCCDHTANRNTVSGRISHKVIIFSAA